MSRAKRKREPSAPRRGSKLAAAPRPPLHYPQGGIHSVIPSSRYPFPLPIEWFPFSLSTSVSPTTPEKPRGISNVKDVYSPKLAPEQTRDSNYATIDTPAECDGQR